MSETEWRDIPGYVGMYRASSCGKVESLPRTISNGRFKTRRRGRILKQHMIKGYWSVRLYDGEGGVKTIGVHRLVAWAFIGTQKPGMVCCHNDGNCLNNTVENIRYDTVRANNRDRIKHNTMVYGSRNGKSKLTEDDVRFIRYKNKTLSYSEMARMYGVSIGCIFNAKNGISWPYVKPH